MNGLFQNMVARYQTLLDQEIAHPLPESPNMLDQEETDQRLAEHRCVWCGKCLHDDSPDATFCYADCQENWHHWKNGNPGYNRPDVPINPPSLDPPPWPGAVAPPQPVSMTRYYPGAIHPSATAASIISRRPASDRQPWANDERDEERERSIIPPGPQHTATDDRTVVGRPMVAFPGMFSLKTIKAEPWGTVWPASQLVTEQRRGWQRYKQVQREMNAAELAEHVRQSDGPFTTADLPMVTAVNGPCPATRFCEHCGTDTFPDDGIINWQRMNLMWNVGVDDSLAASRPEADIVHSRHTMRCSVCKRPHEDPIMVPVYRNMRELGLVDSAWNNSVQIGALTDRGVYIQMITQELLDEAVPGMEAAVWQEVYQGCTRAGIPWECQLPGCTGRATEWTLLTAPMQYRGHIWEPTDGMALRLGWCPEHWYGLQRDLLTGDQLSRVRMGMVASAHAFEYH